MTKKRLAMKHNKKDIVAFGDDGVWVARSTGSGFEAAQFVLAAFGYNQGWRVGKQPRFVNAGRRQDAVTQGANLARATVSWPTSTGTATRTSWALAMSGSIALLAAQADSNRCELCSALWLLTVAQRSPWPGTITATMRTDSPSI